MRFVKSSPPGDVPPEVKAFSDYVNQELQNIEGTFAEQDFVGLVEKHAVPEKTPNGLVVLADGTDWNPGSGAGVYCFYAGAWHKLG